MVNKKEIGDPALGEIFSTPFKTNLQHFYHGQDTKVACHSYMEASTIARLNAF